MRFKRNQPILHTPQTGDMFEPAQKATFFAYDGQRMARIWIFNVGRKTVPLSTIKPREAVSK